MQTSFNLWHSGSSFIRLLPAVAFVGAHPEATGSWQLGTGNWPVNAINATQQPKREQQHPKAISSPVVEPSSSSSCPTLWLLLLSLLAFFMFIASISIRRFSFWPSRCRACLQQYFASPPLSLAAFRPLYSARLRQPTMSSRAIAGAGVEHILICRS